MSTELKWFAKGQLTGLDIFERHIAKSGQESR
jgi:hypothetical protein